MAIDKLSIEQINACQQRYKSFKELVNTKVDEFCLNLKEDTLYGPIHHALCGGGKRVRPVLLLMCLNLFQEETSQGLDLAVAIEVLHNFTLVHDDILDQACLRRNKPTVGHHWSQDVAILTGDTLAMFAVSIISKSLDGQLKSVLNVLIDTAINICRGEHADMLFEKRNDVSSEDYLSMIELKTANLIGASTQLGGIIGGTSISDQQKLYNFGLNLGLSFQIQDDFLDIYGNKSEFGKNIGNDILSNKKTYPLVKALEIASGKDLKLLQEKLSKKAKNSAEAKEKISQVMSILDRYKIGSLTSKKMHYYLDKANQYFEEVDADDKLKEPIRYFIKWLAERAV